MGGGEGGISRSLYIYIMYIVLYIIYMYVRSSFIVEMNVAIYSHTCLLACTSNQLHHQHHQYSVHIRLVAEVLPL